MNRFEKAQPYPMTRRSSLARIALPCGIAALALCGWMYFVSGLGESLGDPVDRSFHHERLTRVFDGLDHGLHVLIEDLRDGRQIEYEARLLSGLELPGADDDPAALGEPRYIAQACIQNHDLARSFVVTGIHIEDVLDEACAVKNSYEEILGTMQGSRHVWAGIPSLVPVDAARLTSRFGVRRDPFTGRWKQHAGCDFAAPYGTPVRASAAGVVERAGYVRGYGLLIEIDHGNGIHTRYGHNSALAAAEGEWVRRGKVIGKVGATGRASAPHLHYEVLVNGLPANPQRHIFASGDVFAAPHNAE